MITALTIDVPEKSKGIRQLLDILKHDRVDVEVKRARGVSIKHVTYTSYSGKVKLAKIDRIIGAQRNHLLCSENLKFPVNSGYKRFFSSEFTSRLCTNMALSVIKSSNCPENLKLGIYDPDGKTPDFLFCVLNYCSDVTVVTQNTEPYYCELRRAMDEFGASAVITSQIQDLDDCKLVVAPCVIKESLPVRGDAVVLTNGCPKVHMGGLIYYKYYLRMPNGFDLIKPNELDEEYFCSALYTLASQYELGSIVPTVCRNFSSSQTVKSLCAYVESISRD